MTLYGLKCILGVFFYFYFVKKTRSPRMWICMYVKANMCIKQLNAILGSVKEKSEMWNDA